MLLFIKQIKTNLNKLKLVKSKAIEIAGFGMIKKRRIM
jgi:hypothetical protein